MINTRVFFIGLIVLLLLCCSLVYLMMQPSDGGIVYITSDGSLIEKINFKQLTEPIEIRVEYEGRVNLIEVSPQGIHVKEADCPDHICINQGNITNGNFPIVCLPNQLVIEVKHDNFDIDAVSK